ncbi:MAG: esterase-like activity of phytase family protein [Pseudomonadota bacterium]
MRSSRAPGRRVAVLVLAVATFWTLAARAEPVRLEAAATKLPPTPVGSELIPVARLRVGGDARIGGLSGVVRTDGGDRLLVVSDRGYLLNMAPRFDERGWLVDLVDAHLVDLPRPAGWSRDTEGLALSDGQLLATFETHGRRGGGIVRYAGPPTAPTGIASHLAARRFRLDDNAGFEALADLPRGNWLAVAETRHPDGFFVRRRDGRERRYRADGNHAPTGADRFGDRTFFVERQVNLLLDWRATIRCAGAAEVDASAELEPLTLARLGQEDGVDNMEAIAVWAHGPDLDLLLVSDDNFSPLQETLFVQYRWPGGASDGCGPRARESTEGQQQQQRHGELGGEIAERPGDPR